MKPQLNEMNVGKVTVYYGFDESIQASAVYVQLDTGLYFGMSPDQAAGLGAQLAEAARKCAQ